MRRSLCVVGLSAVVYALALTLGSYAICHASDAPDVRGEWATQGHSAHVRIEPCDTAPPALCGTITWLWEAVDSDGQPVRDRRNPDPRLRERLLMGLPLLREFRPLASGEWSGGQIYNPENGRTYAASLRLRNPDLLEVKGCVLFVCDTQVWRRAESLCRQSANE